MSANKKYYWLKLKDDFFDSEEMVLLQSMQDGYLYSDILLKMYLKSLKAEGRLMFKDHIPYNPNMIATITKHSVGTVEKALDIFKNLGMIEVLDNNAIYMLDIQSLIGEGSSEADRKKAYRERIKHEQLMIGGGHLSGHSSPEIDKDLELEKEKDIYIEQNDKIDPLDSRDNFIKKYALIFQEITGIKHRRISESFDFNDAAKETEHEVIYDHISKYFQEGKVDMCYMEYFNTVVDRYR